MKKPVTLGTSDVKQREYKEVNIKDPNPDNSYMTKRHFTGFCTEVNPKVDVFNEST